MRFLYIFPHPDDESFGPAGVINKQIREGHEVFLLTLTKGEATKMRYRIGVSAREMAQIRYEEMLAVEARLKLTGMTVLDHADGLLAHMDPRILEEVVKEHIEAIKPDVVVTYPVHGISGHHDHLTAHAVVKRVFLDMKSKGKDFLKRLAFFTLPREAAHDSEALGGNFQVNRSMSKYIDCIIDLNEEDRKAFLDALDCYETFKEVVEATGVKNTIGYQVYFEIFNEEHDPPLKALEALL